MENTNASSNDNRTSIANCLICNQPYTLMRKVPITLQCGHTFCKQCLEDLEREDMDLRCPTCRYRTWQNTRQMKKNHQFIDLLIANGLIQTDNETSSANNQANVSTENQTEQPNIDENRLAIVPTTGSLLLNEARRIFESMERMHNAITDIFRRIEQVTNNRQGSQEFYRQVLWIFRLIHDFSYQLRHRVLIFLDQRIDLSPALPRNVLQEVRQHFVISLRLRQNLGDRRNLLAIENTPETESGSTNGTSSSQSSNASTNSNSNSDLNTAVENNDDDTNA